MTRGPILFPRCSSNSRGVSSLTLEKRQEREKSIRGGGTSRRFLPRFARRNLAWWSAWPTPFGRLFDPRFAQSLRLAHPRRWRVGALTSELALLAGKRPTGAFPGCSHDHSVRLRSPHGREDWPIAVSALTLRRRCSGRYVLELICTQRSLHVDARKRGENLPRRTAFVYYRSQALYKQTG